MDKGLLKTAIACVTALAVALILAASVKYYTDGTRYGLAASGRGFAYIIDRKDGRALFYCPATGKDPVFSLPDFKKIDDFLGESPRK